jgi:replicative DNA helicase
MRTNEDFIAASEYQVLKILLTNEFNPRDIIVSFFPHKEARAIFSAIQILKDKKESLTVSSILREANAIEDSVTIDIVQEVFNHPADTSNWDSAVAFLKEGSKKYRLKEEISTILEATQTSDTLNHAEVSESLFNSLQILLTGNTPNDARTLEVCIDSYVEELLVRKEGRYHLFNDDFLDEHLTRKASPGQIIMIAGSTGTGKSAFVLNLVNGMININKPCIYFSLEMDTISTMDRLLSMRTNIPVSNFYTKGPDMDNIIKIVKGEKEALKDKPFRFIDNPMVGLDDIQSILRDFKMTYKVEYVTVFIDLITQVKEFVDMNSRNRTLASTIEMAINRLNAIAKMENVCFVCVAQMNRDADSAKIETIDELEQLRPSFNHIKNSGALGERARVVLSVFRPKYYALRLFPDMENSRLMEDILEVQILKQNQGISGIVGRYTFDGPCFRIEAIPERI